MNRSLNQPLLSVGSYAETPYYLSKLCVNIWSVEELCYLFKTNPFVLDQDILDERLAVWLERECRLGELARKIHNLFHKANSVSLFVTTILEYVNYCTDSELRQITEVLQGNVGLSEYEKMKRRADFLMTKRKYLLAIQEYDRILDRLPLGERSIRDRSCHNRGVACANLFLFDRAAESFLSAYESSGNEESGIQYLTAVRRQLSDDEYIRFIADRPQFYNLSLKVEHLVNQAMGWFETTKEKKRLDELKGYKEEGDTDSYYAEIGRLTGEIRRCYKNSVME